MGTLEFTIQSEHVHSLFTHLSFTKITKKVLTIFQIMLSNISIHFDSEILIEIATSLAIGHGVERLLYVNLLLLDVKHIICYQYSVKGYHMTPQHRL